MVFENIKIYILKVNIPYTLSAASMIKIQCQFSLFEINFVAGKRLNKQNIVMLQRNPIFLQRIEPEILAFLVCVSPTIICVQYNFVENKA